MINISQFYQGSTTTSTNFTTLTLSQVFFKQFCSIFLLALLENVHIIHCKTLCTNSNIPKQADGKFWDALETTTRHKERKWPMWAGTILKNSMKCTRKTKSVLKNSPAHLLIFLRQARRTTLPSCSGILAAILRCQRAGYTVFSTQKMASSMNVSFSNETLWPISFPAP